VAAFGLHALVNQSLKGYDPSYVVFGKQCMQCVIPGSLIVAGDVTVFRPKGIAFRTLVFCRVEFHVSQIRPVLSLNAFTLAHEFPGSLERGGVPHAEDSPDASTAKVRTGSFKAPEVQVTRFFLRAPRPQCTHFKRPSVFFFLSCQVTRARCGASCRRGRLIERRFAEFAGSNPHYPC
jgi:hypothetical protein